MDFVKNNPTPPCDYSDLIPQGTAVGAATPGSYVVKVGEHFSGGYTKIQWNKP
jgi:hypothetical protein